MCTVILLHRVFPAWPVFIAANRDEALGRPSADFEVHDGAHPWLGPSDLRAGGTWLGISPRGVVAAVTNRYGASPDPSRASRGRLVPMLLESDTASDAARRLGELDPAAYNPFHVVLADAETAFVAHAADGRMRVDLVTAPLVVTERSFGAAPTAREARLRPAVRALAASGTDSPGAWQALLATHHETGFDGTCVHTPGQQYGTRSSVIVALGPGNTTARLRTAWGPPCVTPFLDLDLDLDAFTRAGGLTQVTSRVTTLV